jgi:ribosomal protein L14E/L6E/L27E
MNRTCWNVQKFPREQAKHKETTDKSMEDVRTVCARHKRTTYKSQQKFTSPDKALFTCRPRSEQAPQRFLLSADQSVRLDAAHSTPH